MPESNPVRIVAIDHDNTDFSGGALSLVAAQSGIGFVVVSGLIQAVSDDVADIAIGGTAALTGPLQLDQSGAAGAPAIPIPGPIHIPAGQALKLFSAASALAISGWICYKLDI